MRVAAFSLFAIAGASPAYAWAGVQIPEPSNMALFAMGLAGVAIGRRFSRARQRRDEE